MQVKRLRNHQQDEYSFVYFDHFIHFLQILEKFMACSAMLDRQKVDYWQRKKLDNEVSKVLNAHDQLSNECQQVADEATKMYICIGEYNDKLAKMNHALDSLKTGQMQCHQQLNLDVHREHIEAFIRDVRDGENHSKIVSPQRQISEGQGASEVGHCHVMCLEEFGRWVENHTEKLNHVISANQEQSTWLDNIGRVTIQEEQEYETLEGDFVVENFERQSQEWIVLCKSQSQTISDLADRYEKLFTTALELMPNMIMTYTTKDQEDPLLSFKAIGDFIDMYHDKYICAVNAFIKIKQGAKTASDNLSASFDLNCKLFKTFVDLKQQLPTLKPRLEDEKLKLDRLMEDLESCRQRLQLHSERVTDLRQKHDVQTEAKNQKRQEEIDRVIAARNNYECLGLIAPETFYDNYTK